MWCSFVICVFLVLFWVLMNYCFCFCWSWLLISLRLVLKVGMSMVSGSRFGVSIWVSCKLCLVFGFLLWVIIGRLFRCWLSWWCKLIKVLCWLVFWLGICGGSWLFCLFLMLLSGWVLRWLFVLIGVFMMFWLNYWWMCIVVVLMICLSVGIMVRWSGWFGCVSFWLS